MGTYQETSSHALREGTLGHSRLSSLSHCGLILKLLCLRVSIYAEHLFLPSLLSARVCLYIFYPHRIYLLLQGLHLFFFFYRAYNFLNTFFLIGPAFSLSVPSLFYARRTPSSPPGPVFCLSMPSHFCPPKTPSLQGLLST